MFVYKMFVADASPTTRRPPEHTVHDDLKNEFANLSSGTVKRFLIANREDVSLTRKALVEHQSWLSQVHDKQARFEPEENERGEISLDYKRCVRNDDDDGDDDDADQTTPVLVIEAKKHAIDNDNERLYRHSLWAMDKALSTADRIVVMFDMGSFGWPNVDITFFRRTVTLQTRHYPETLKWCLLVDCPMMFYGIWKLFEPCFDRRTWQKIKFVSRAEIGKYLK